jgi:RNA ligase (TIGR02306 family)
MRKLATVRKIDALEPIDGADLIETASIGGWKVVVKKGEFEVNTFAVYFEIDSFIPNELAPFLTSEGKEPREYNGIKGERLRTVKLRKQISQGLLLPLTVVYDAVKKSLNDLNIKLETMPIIYYEEDMDVSDLLNIHKYEPPMPTQLAGMAKGNFPSFIPKTDEERVQNLSRFLYNWIASQDSWEVTEKYDGSSMTVYIKDGTDEEGNPVRNFGVCSRNLELKDTADNSFWKQARADDIENKLRELVPDRNIAIQGELIGEGIQSNKYRILGTQFHVFTIYDIDKGEYLSSDERVTLAKKLGLNHVEVLEKVSLYRWHRVGTGVNANDVISGLLNYAEGKSVLNNKTEREGVVFKNTRDPSLHFKAISNKFLLKGGE